MKNERDSNIQKMYTRHNLGPLPNAPFSDDVALNLTNRLKSRLVDLDKDLQDKKVTPPRYTIPLPVCLCKTQIVYAQISVLQLAS